MFLRKHYRKLDGIRKPYWALVESYRTERGPRQRVVAYLGELDERGRLGMERAARGNPTFRQQKIFEEVEPEWVEVDVKGVRVERSRRFGGAWLGLELVKRLGLWEFLNETIPPGREEIPWAMMALLLVLCRLCDPSSELYIAEHLYERLALEDLLGIPADKVNDDRLYRALDQLLPHKEALETHLKNRLGTLFDVEYDLLLYDVTSTYFEGAAAANPQAKRGYSRDHRPDCKQVCIALVVSRGGLPLGYEVFDGNRADVTTVEEIVETVESRYGAAGRIWVMDRGMISEENITYLKEGGRRYIVGTPKGQLKAFERDLLEDGWESIREGLEVKRCASPDGEETFILCRSVRRQEKEHAIHARFEKRIEAGLTRIAESCTKRRQRVGVIERRVGRLLGQNSRAAGLFDVEVRGNDKTGARLFWRKKEAWREWAEQSEGCYLLRSNVNDWSAEDLWEAYIQLTQAESAFRIHKSDLQLRPIWHQTEERVKGHILVCFLAYVLWRTLGQLCDRAGLGHEPRKVFDELSEIRMVDVVLPTRKGINLRKRCITHPTGHQSILLHHLGLALPSHMKMTEM
jgi:transposase